MLRNLHRRKKNFFFIYEVIVKQKKRNALLITTRHSAKRRVCEPGQKHRVTDDQEAYFDTLLAKYEGTDCNPNKVPFKRL